jgi:hypothetical protein
MVGLSLIAFVIGGVSYGSPQMRDVLDGIADHEATVTSFSVRFDIESASFTEAGQTGSCVWHDTVLCDRIGRYRIEGERLMNAAVPRRDVQVFDGQVRREAFGEQGTLSIGMTGSRATPFFLPINPFEIIWQFQEGAATSAYLEKRNATLVGEIPWEDRAGEKRSVWAIETRAVDGKDGITRKAQVYVDHERGFVVVRKAMLAHRSDAIEWVTNWSIELRDHAEAASGVWVPTTIEFINYYIFHDNRTSPAQTVRCRATQWSINPQLDQATFAFSFPKGVAVNDEATGKMYVAGTVTDPLIATQVDEARQLVNKQGPWLVVVAVIVPAAIVLIWLWIKLASKGASNSN